MTSEKTKKTVRKILAVALAAATITGTSALGLMPYSETVGGITVSAAEASSNFEYSVNNDNTVTITKYTGTNVDIEIPKTIDGKKVTGISGFNYQSVFNKDVKSVTIPNSVTQIGSCAFYNLVNLTSVNIPNSVKSIGDHAFQGCNALTSITIPNSVTLIDEWAFWGCYSLTRITIGNSVTSIGLCAFGDCSGLTSVTIPNSVKSIGDRAFENCKNLTNVTIQDGVNETKIGFGSFNSCPNLKSILIPDSVVSISEGAFGYVSIFYPTVIYGVKESCAEIFADAKKIPFVSISAKEILLGQTVTLDVQNSKSGNTYAVLYKKKTDTKWTVKQNYSENTQVTIKPAKATDYQVCVKVKDSTGTIYKKYFTLKVSEKLANTSTLSAATIKHGSSVTAKCSATGGKGSYTYAVLYKKTKDTKWIVKQNYSANTQVTIKPDKVADYQICVKVKDSRGVISKTYLDVKVTK